ncbi:hypothetical protein L3Q82_026859 [Scortum barcoo]|uniref:Uncharacterized protein n=1 Tax=Scortum barcoo TaxID=214431 RepID=A0ACB8WJP4_9TELE|nr:hypothetical protein L3Q82_026859 [Scortum barcoo]
MRFFVPVVEHWTSSIPSTGCLRVYGSLPNQSTCALWIWRRHSTVSLRGILWGGAPRVWGPGAFAKGCSVSVRPEQELGSHCRQPWFSNRKRVACPLRVGGEILPQVEEFKYLGVLFTSEGKMEREIDRRIGAASAVMRVGVPDRRGEEGAESKGEALDLPVNLHVPTLTYGHELWVMTERTRSCGYKRLK